MGAKGGAGSGEQGAQRGQGADYRLRTTDYGLRDYGPRTTDHETTGTSGSARRWRRLAQIKKSAGNAEG